MPTNVMARKSMIRSMIAALAVAALMVTGLGTGAPAQTSDDVLNASEMDLGAVAVGRFTVTATEEKPGRG
jgi:hypothetical protein